MKRFIAILNDQSYVNVAATRMELVDNALNVWNGVDLVAYIDVSVILSAHISERAGKAYVEELNDGN